MKQKKKREESVFARIAKAGDLPVFAAGKDETIEIKGGNTVQVEGVQGIYTYEPETVCLKMKGYRLILKGKDFDLNQFGVASFQVTGKLSKIEWED